MRLAKYHALGNDFLVLSHLSAVPSRSEHPGVAGVVTPLDAASVVALCDRHTGVGADGVLELTSVPAGLGIGADVTREGRAPSPAHPVLRMTLRNADGGVAETSGNGLRCAALAAFDEGLVAGCELILETMAGSATARLVERDGAGGATLSVSMGRAQLGEAGGDVLGRLWRRVDVGNPHLVLYPDPARPAALPLRAVELAPLEQGVDGEVVGGLNVEAVTPPVRGSAGEPDRVDLVVWERGAGVTQACGSGSVAAASVLRGAGLVGEAVAVRNPGGTLLVELSGPIDSPEAVLTGPACFVASVDVDLASLVARRIAAHAERISVAS